MKVTSPKKLEIQERRSKTEDCLREGLVMSQIAEKLGVSWGTVKLDVDAVLEQWRVANIDSYDEHVNAELRKRVEIYNEAAEQWEKSKGRKQTIIKQLKDNGGKEITVKTLLPEYRFLEVMLKTSESIAKLLGLDKPIKIEGRFESFTYAMFVEHLDDVRNGGNGKGNGGNNRKRLSDGR